MTKTNEERFKSLRKLFTFGTKLVEVQPGPAPHKVQYATTLLISDGFGDAVTVDLTYDVAKKLRDDLDRRIDKFEQERQIAMNAHRHEFAAALEKVYGAQKFSALVDAEQVAKVVRDLCEEFPSSQIPLLGCWLLIYFHHMADDIQYGFRYAVGSGIS